MYLQSIISLFTYPLSGHVCILFMRKHAISMENLIHARQKSSGKLIKANLICSRAITNQLRS